MDIEPVRMELPDGANIIIGHAHFIKTAEDLYEAMVNSVPGVRFGIAFCEASQERLIRVEGNEDELRGAAQRNALAIGAGHTFVVVLKEAFPINVLGAIRACPEVVGIYCATANPVQVLVAETDQGRGVLGVVDGLTPAGVEEKGHVKERKDFLRKIGYKL